MTAKVYACISAVQKQLATDGISKGRKNQQQGYSFRGIDDVLNALSPILAGQGLCVLPRMLSRECVERQTKSGGALFYVTVDAEFDFVAVEDGSKHTVKTFGEAMDSADKATNKAMSAAYKYAAILAFAIPTEGDNDADATSHDVASRKTDKAAQRETWIVERLAEIASCKSTGELKKIMDAALSVVREERDQDAEDRLLEASAAKVSKAKAAKPVIDAPPSHDAFKARQLEKPADENPY